jgi:uncharacterized DUF497 family protein
MKFEWNEHKNQANELKHGINFAGAVLLFLDKDRIELIDKRQDYGEDRY